MASLHTPDALTDYEWPPGTIRLEDLSRVGKNGEIILQPRPSRDPNDPLNWQQWRKNLNFGLACLYVLMIYTVIDVVTPTWTDLNEQLGFSYDLLNNAFAVGSGTMCLGAFFLIPFALKYGRRPVYLVSLALQMGCCIWSAKMQTSADLILTSAFTCFLGALSEVMVQLTVKDCFFVHHRGVTNSIFVWATNVGLWLSVVAAGYITVSEGWRWVWWWTAIFFGATFILFLFCYEETKFTPTLEGLAAEPTTAELQDPLGHESHEKAGEKSRAMDSEKAAATVPTVSSDSDEHRHYNVVDIDMSIPRKTYLQRLALWQSSPSSASEFLRHAWQPFQVLFLIPAVFYMSVVYGALSVAIQVMVTTLSQYMAEPPYNFNADQIGLMGLPPFIGTTIGTIICGPISDWIVLRLARRNNGIYEPEMRLWVIAAFIPFVPAGIFMFGFGLNNGAPWPVLAVGYALCNFGTTPANSIAITYVTDAYQEIVGDALVGMTFIRNILATICVTVLNTWIANVGMKNVFVMIGVILTAILLGNVVFLIWGKRFRVYTAKRYRYFASRQFEHRAI